MQKTLHGQNYLEKEGQILFVEWDGWFTVPDFKAYFKAAVTKQSGTGMWIDKWVHGTETMEMKHAGKHTSRQHIFDKTPWQINGERKDFSTNGAGTIE